MCKDKHDDKTKTTLINSNLKQMIHSLHFCVVCVRGLHGLDRQATLRGGQDLP